MSPGIDAARFLWPNHLLIIAAIAEMSRPGALAPVGGAKADFVGWRAGQNAAWVHRHGTAINDTWPEGMGWVHLSVNGHCMLTGPGRMVDWLLRGAKVSLLPAPPSSPDCCCICGATRVSTLHGVYQLYACGCVSRWCPPHLPGHPSVAIPPRQRKAQHDGVWFPAVLGRRHHNEAQSTDGTLLARGHIVQFGQGIHLRWRAPDTDQFVLAAAAGTVLVFDVTTSDILPASANDLVIVGRPDLTGLSDYQREVAFAASAGTLERLDDGGAVAWRLKGRKVAPATVAELTARRVLPPSVTT